MQPQEVAESLLTEAAAEEGVTFDPSIFIAIFQAIMAMFENCRQTPEQAAARMANPSAWDIARITRKVKMEMGLRAYRDNDGPSVVRAMIRAAKAATVEQYATIMQEV